jgi:hypothetical protein
MYQHCRHRLVIGCNVRDSVENARVIMLSAIKKWGNSAAIRIPAAVMKDVEFDLDEIVDVREEEGANHHRTGMTKGLRSARALGRDHPEESASCC